ncbi:MAG: GTPase Era [Sphingomonadaceae bacterium]
MSRCGVVAMVGAPNAGKSTLVNALVGQKVAIVTPKPQTTRVRLMGIALCGDAQMLLIDTPGVFAPRRRLDRAMVATAWEGARDADLIALIVDSAHGLEGPSAPVLARLGEREEAKILILNKIDLVRKERLLALADAARAALAFEEIFMVSAATGDGVADLKAKLAQRMPEGPWLFPEEQVSDASERLLAAEATREQLYLKLREELPHQSAVATEKFEERPDGSAAIHQQILVAKDSQKGIVVGKGGRTIKAIGEAAREELETLLGRRVHLFLHVKVKPGWDEERSFYRELGLEWVD